MTDRTCRPIEERFWAKVEKTDTCWLWTGARVHNGYGTLGRGRAGSGEVRVHRLAYELLIGPIPEGAQIDHRCHVRHCVNPTHLQAVTPAANQQNRSGSWAQSGARGVYRARGRNRYFVSVTAGGVRHYGGMFDTVEEAAQAAADLRNRVMTNNLTDRLQ